MKSGRGGHVIDFNWVVQERGGGHHVLARALVGFYNGVGGLAWGNFYGINLERFYVGGVNFYHGELVPSNLEEELLIEARVDYT